MPSCKLLLSAVLFPGSMVKQSQWSCARGAPSNHAYTHRGDRIMHPQTILYFLGFACRAEGEEDNAHFPPSSLLFPPMLKKRPSKDKGNSGWYCRWVWEFPFFPVCTGAESCAHISAGPACYCHYVSVTVYALMEGK